MIMLSASENPAGGWGISCLHQNWNEQPERQARHVPQATELSPQLSASCLKASGTSDTFGQASFQ
jgi:hypothetical protein